jgi:16S rRNA (guanine966-N2)-methyltransferase
MRVIAGSARGIRLKMVPGNHVRPTSDRVKETLFQVIGPYFDGGWALDLFAGTGSLGIEALSRGCDRVVFVDRSRASVHTIKDNLQKTGFIERSEVHREDVRSALRKLVRREIRFRLVFLDPPYRENLLMPVLEKIAAAPLLGEGGVVVAEHDFRHPPPDRVATLRAYRRMTFGEAAITLYAPDADE